MQTVLGQSFLDRWIVDGAFFEGVKHIFRMREASSHAVTCDSGLEHPNSFTGYLYVRLRS